MLPFTKFPFWLSIFDPQPNDRIEHTESRPEERARGVCEGPHQRQRAGGVPRPNFSRGNFHLIFFPGSDLFQKKTPKAP